ncbi:MAG: uracil-DNA glycosylase [Flavobacteriales bacterium]|nr:uracil-DNA glycosylase [Flavobacteriales bacterium]
MDVRIHESWKSELEREFEQPYFKQLTDFVRDEYRNNVCYPPGNRIFSAFDYCPFDAVRVVILGQDPYHGPGQANGLCFSVNDGVAVPRSLMNIYKEIASDLGKEVPAHGNLERWAKQGVLLLNATLTVRAHQAGSHQNQGWEQFTDAVVQAINDHKERVVFILWGSYAQQKGAVIEPAKHCILKSPHPSPLSASRGFFGCRHFSAANAYLREHGLPTIDW